MSPHQYQILLLAAQALFHSAIAEAFDPVLNIGTTGTRLHQIYDKLGRVYAQAQAGTFVPIRKAELDELALDINDDSGHLVPQALTGPEKGVFVGIGQGLTFQQIALQHGRVDTTARKHAHKIYNKLAIPKTIHQEVALARLAGALPNLQAYQAITERVGQSDIAGQAAAVLRHLGDAQSGPEAKLNLTPGEPVYTIENKRLLALLEAGRYVPLGTSEHGRLFLDGLVAALLMQRSTSQAVIRDPHAHAVVREIISQQVSQFWASRGTDESALPAVA